MNKTTISIVMTSYNGEKHILAQMESLRKQTREADEVLILDDRSTDGTVEMIREFIREHELKQWKLIVNQEKQGWKKNFIRGIRIAKGDFLFLCDQDDRWYPEKIKEMTETIEENDHIFLLACDYKVIYETGAIRAKVYRKSREEQGNTIGKYQFRKRFFMNPNPGCTYVMRRSFVKETLDYWFSEAPHDEFFWLMATFQEGAFFYNKVLMDYIRYEKNASGVRFKDIQMQIENLKYIGTMLEKLESFAREHPGKVSEEKRTEIRKAEIWCQKRKKLMETRNPLRWVVMIPYWSYYNSIQNCLSDLYLVLFGSFYRNKI